MRVGREHGVRACVSAFARMLTPRARACPRARIIARRRIHRRQRTLRNVCRADQRCPPGARCRGRRHARAGRADSAHYHGAREGARARAAGRPQWHARAHRAHVHAVLTPLHSLAPRQATNPFLRPDSPALQECIGMAGRPLGEVWAETRKRKDNF